MVEQAKELRTKILTDLSNRRRVLHLQIEQLQAGRERLSEAVQGVRVSVDSITNDLLRAEDDARVAAEEAGRIAAAKPDLGFEEPDLSVSPALEASLAEAPPTRRAETELEETKGATAPGATEPAPEAEASSGARSSGAPSAVGPPLNAEAGQTPEAVVTEASAPQVDQRASSDLGQPSGGIPPRHKQVDDLFARLRANGTADGASNGGSPTGNGDAPRESSTPADPQVVDPDAGVELADDEPTTELIRPIELVRKDELLSPVIAGLARRVKRALQDDQNDILDRIRSQGGWKDGVLPELSEHTSRYVAASTEMLAEAARAGATFAGVGIDFVGDVDAEATKLAADVVGSLRRRLEDDGPTVDPTDDAALVEHVGAAFREWRGDRTDRLAGDHATSAFATAALAATAKDVTIRWIVDDEGAPCADCEDNALAEDVTPGDPFPTGHSHPPAHSGCRCLLVVPVAT
jgi:hypothetical protein